MTSDLVKELRKLAAIDNCQASLEAAARIERLRAALLLIRDMGPMTADDQRWRVAKDALEGK